MDSMILGLLALAALVYLLNLVPVFAPPTWMALALIGMNFPGTNAWAIALTGALAATAGRLTLAALSHAIVRRKLLSEAQRANVDVIRLELSKRPRMTAGAFLAYAFSPLPSNLLFIAYGLTGLPRRQVALPFFVGRLCSYSFFIFTGQALGKRFNEAPVDGAYFAGGYFIISQFLILVALWLFTRIDWAKLLRERKIGWVNHHKPPPGGNKDKQDKDGTHG